MNTLSATITSSARYQDATPLYILRKHQCCQRAHRQKRENRRENGPKMSPRNLNCRAVL